MQSAAIATAPLAQRTELTGAERTGPELTGGELASASGSLRRSGGSFADRNFGNTCRGSKIATQATELPKLTEIYSALMRLDKVAQRVGESGLLVQTTSTIALPHCLGCAPGCLLVQTTSASALGHCLTTNIRRRICGRRGSLCGKVLGKHLRQQNSRHQFGRCKYPSI